MTHTLTRRQLLGAAGVSAAALAFGGAFRASAADGVQIQQQVWTGAQEIVPRRKSQVRFEQPMPGVSVTVSPGSSNAVLNTIVAARKAGTPPPINVGFFNLENTARGLAEDAWVLLDPAVVTNLDQIADDFRLPNDVGAFPWIDLGGIIYNAEKVPEPPKSWKDLFDPKYHGRVATFDGFWTGNGLLATAYANGGSLDDIEPALKIYEEAARSGTSTRCSIRMPRFSSFWRAAKSGSRRISAELFFHGSRKVRHSVMLHPKKARSCSRKVSNFWPEVRTTSCVWAVTS